MDKRPLSIAGLMRLQFMVALAFAWPIAIRRLPPELIHLSFLAISAVLAVVVGWRRRSSPRRAAASVLLFFSGGTFVGGYSAFTAKTVQTPEPPYHDGAHPWATLDALPAAAFVALGFPLAAAVVVCLLRAWINSIHDRTA